MGFGLKNCTSCGNVFSSPKDICPDCVKKEEDACETCHKYLRDYPHATMAEVAAITGVEEELIIKFVKQGRIKASNLDAMAFASAGGKCVQCGVSTEKGNYCPSCLAKLKSATSSAAADLSERSGIVKDSVHSDYSN